ncbi:MAG: hypothetical protein OXG10_00960 [Candidatus Dadabacteria bacterium]|nr:hypothetical protein [Candidatus Dadabacteria bacterium]
MKSTDYSDLTSRVVEVTPIDDASDYTHVLIMHKSRGKETTGLIKLDKNCLIVSTSVVDELVRDYYLPWINLHWLNYGVRRKDIH